jgi:hypothetical protein
MRIRIVTEGASSVDPMTLPSAYAGAAPKGGAASARAITVSKPAAQ